MARLPDVERRRDLLEQVVDYLAANGLANLSLRPMAKELGVSVNALMHHFGSKDDLIVEALRHSSTVQRDIEARWLARKPGMSQVDILRSWWRWINASPANLAIVRLGIEAAAIDATIGGLPRPVRARQIGQWRKNIEERLIEAGIPPGTAVTEATLAEATFTGLVVDLLSSGAKARLTRSLEVALARIDQLIWAHAGLSEPAIPASTRSRQR